MPPLPRTANRPALADHLEPAAAGLAPTTPADARFVAAPHPRVRAVPAFDDNYLWLVLSADGRRCAVVDPGDAAPVERALDALGATLEAILLTHHHADHVGGCARLAARPEAPRIWGPADDRITGIDHPVRDGDRIALPSLGLAARVIAVPGHTRSHIAWACEPLAGSGDPRPLLFCGDTLFAAGCGRLFEGIPADMAGSLRRLAELPGPTLVFCAHEYTLSNLAFAVAALPGDDALAARQAEARELRAAGRPTVPSTMAVERATNPFLRAALGDDEGTRAAAAARLGRDPADATEAFGALRAWKDVYR